MIKSSGNYYLYGCINVKLKPMPFSLSGCLYARMDDIYHRLARYEDNGEHQHSGVFQRIYGVIFI